MTKALPQGLDLAYDAHGLDTVLVTMAPSDGFLVAERITSQRNEDKVVVMLCGWLEECQGEKEYRKHKADRLRLLEAVAEAVLAACVAYGLDGNGPAAQLDEAMGAGMEALAQLGELYYSSGAGKILGEEALAALEALDEKEQP